MTFEELVADLVDTRARISELRERERELVDAVHNAAPARKNETSYGLVEVSKRYNRKWDHDELTKHVVARALDERSIDAETGEVEPSWVVVTRALRDCAGISYWRLGALRDRGLDPDEFAETTSEARTVQIR